MPTLLTKNLLGDTPINARREYAAWLGLLEATLPPPHSETGLLRQLRRTLDDGQSIEALYSEHQTPTRSMQPLYAHHGWQAAQLFTPARGHNNQDILDALADGIGVLGLDVKNHDGDLPDFARLLKGVLVPIMPVSLHTHRWEHVRAMWEHLVRSGITRKYVGYLNLPAALADEHFSTMLAQTRAYPHMRLLAASGLHWHDAGASDTQELAALCAEIVQALRTAERLGIAPKTVLPRLTLQITVGEDFFVSLAKMRALHLLWAQLLKPLRITIAPHIEAHISQRSYSTGDIWLNVLRATSAALAAGIGGCHVMMLPAHTAPTQKDDAQALALARHTQTLLQEESHIGEVADAAAGSWYIEQFSAQLAQTAWMLFQDIERKGGMARATRWLRGRCQAHFTNMHTALAQGEQPLLGINRFVDLQTTLPTARRNASPKRLAQDFETLRARITAIKPRKARPIITLAQQTPKLATLSDWARQLFASGGLASTEPIPADSICTKHSTGTADVLAVLCDMPPDADSILQWRKAGFAHIYLLSTKPLSNKTARTHGRQADACFVQGDNQLAFLQTVHQALGLGT